MERVIKMLKKDDKVVMENCGEAKHYEGIVWTCSTNEWITNEGRGVYEQRLVMLEDFSGSFHTKYLRKIEVADGEIVLCESCNKSILVDSKGYVESLDLEGTYCLQCAKERNDYLKAQKLVNDAMKKMTISHTVIKNSDVETYLDKSDQAVFEECVGRIQVERAMKGLGNENYIVINPNEEPKMVKEIIEIMKSYNRWAE